LHSDLIEGAKVIKGGGVKREWDHFSFITSHSWRSL